MQMTVIEGDDTPRTRIPGAGEGRAGQRRIMDTKVSEYKLPSSPAKSEELLGSPRRQFEEDGNDDLFNDLVNTVEQTCTCSNKYQIINSIRTLQSVITPRIRPKQASPLKLHLERTDSDKE